MKTKVTHSFWAAFVTTLCALLCLQAFATTSPDECPIKGVAPKKQRGRPAAPPKPYIWHPDFATDGDSPAYLAEAEKLAVSLEKQERRATAKDGTSLANMRTLTPGEEKLLFKAMNYLKYRATKTGLDPKQVAADLAQAKRLRDIIILANLRLAISTIQRFGSSTVPEEDLLGEALRTVIKAVDGFDVSKGWKFSTYFTTAAVRNFMRGASKESRVREHEKDGSQLPDGQNFNPPDYREPSPEANAEAKEMRAKLWEALGKLPDKEREVLVLYFGLNGEEPIKDKEIAEKIGYSKSRVSQWRNDALRKMRRLLGDDFIELLSLDE